MTRFSSVIRFVMFATLLALVLPAFAVQAQQIEDEYYFEPNSASCGDFVPIEADLELRTRGDRYQVYLEFEITEEQIDAEECAGSHFDVRFYLTGFDELNDWSSCVVDYDHDYTFGWDVIDTGDGTAVATLYGAKLVDDRLSPGDMYWIEVNCTDLWPDRHGDPSVSVEYVGTWWTTDLDTPDCEPTQFVTSGTKGPAGLPVCVQYSGQSAQLLDSDWDDEFPFEY